MKTTLVSSICRTYTRRMLVLDWLQTDTHYSNPHAHVRWGLILVLDARVAPFHFILTHQISIYVKGLVMFRCPMQQLPHDLSLVPSYILHETPRQTLLANTIYLFTHLGRHWWANILYFSVNCCIQPSSFIIVVLLQQCMHVCQFFSSMEISTNNNQWTSVGAIIIQ